MAQIKLFWLGPPRIEKNGNPIEIGLRKALALLAYLSVTGQPHSREALAALFWPEDDQGAALGNLRRALYRINQALGWEVLRATRKTVEFLSREDIWVDTAIFQQHVEACLPRSASTTPDPANADRLAAAAELYRGRFLEGFTLPASLAFDEWQFFQAESLQRSFSRVLEGLVAIHRLQAAWEPAILAARRWVALDPLDEAAQRSLMELYALAGRQSTALRQYAEYQRILDAELGIRPEEATIVLHEAIKNRQFIVQEGAGWDASPSRAFRPSSQPQTLHNLPVHPLPFIGRQVELAEIRTLLADNRLVNILGPGGIGKTRLALELAYGVLPSFPGGVFFVSFSPALSPESVLPTIAEQIGCRFQDSHPAREQLLRFLRLRRMLLVLDNFRHLAPAAGLIADMLLAAPDLKVLVTSRERLHLTGEVVYPLGSMQWPEEASSVDISESSSIELFLQCARLARHSLELQPDDLVEVARICRLVQGMPLALVLAAAWVDLLSFKEIADEIAHNLDFLESRWQDAPERHHSVRAAFEYSWKRLPDPDRQAFMRLSVFQGSFTRQDAQRVVGAGIRTLRRLIDKSLIFIRRDSRYEIHELLRQYAIEQLEASGEYAQIRRSHSHYYLSVLKQREAGLKGRRQFETLDEIDADLENIHLAWQWALQEQKEAEIAGALESLFLYFTFRSRTQEGADFFRTAWRQLAPCPVDEPARVCRRLLARSAWFRSLRLYPEGEAETDIQECLLLAQKHADRAEVAFCYLLLGCYRLIAKRDPAGALPFLERSLDYYWELDDPFYVAAALLGLGTCHGEATSLENMIRFSSQSLALARAHRNQALIPYALRNLSLGALCSGDYLAAEQYCHEALAIDSEMNFLLGMAEAKTQLGLLAFLRGDLQEAGRLASEGLDIGKEAGFSSTIAGSLAVQSLLSSVEGDPARGKVLAEESLAIPSAYFETILAKWGLSLACLSLGQLDEAWQAVHEALELAGRLSYTAARVWPLPVVAVLLARHGEAVLAMESLSSAFHSPYNLTGWVDCWSLMARLRAGLEEELDP